MRLIEEVGVASCHNDRVWNRDRASDWRPWLGACVAALALGLGVWLFWGAKTPEMKHDNWKHVATAGKHSTSDEATLVHVDLKRNENVVNNISLSRRDDDTNTTRAVRLALRRRDLASAQSKVNSAVIRPKLGQAIVMDADTDLLRSVSDSRSKFYRLTLFDSCDEDGDVIQLQVNGKAFATVPIMHAGCTLSIPLKPGSNSITLTGIRDGVGGITVAFTTSKGRYFSQRMRVGQQLEIDMVVPS